MSSVSGVHVKGTNGAASSSTQVPNASTVPSRSIQLGRGVDQVIRAVWAIPGAELRSRVSRAATSRSSKMKRAAAWTRVVGRPDDGAGMFDQFAGLVGHHEDRAIARVRIVGQRVPGGGGYGEHGVGCVGAVDRQGRHQATLVGNEGRSSRSRTGGRLRASQLAELEGEAIGAIGGQARPRSAMALARRIDDDIVERGDRPAAEVGGDVEGKVDELAALGRIIAEKGRRSCRCRVVTVFDDQEGQASPVEAPGRRPSKALAQASRPKSL